MIYIHITSTIEPHLNIRRRRGVIPHGEGPVAVEEGGDGVGVDAEAREVRGGGEGADLFWGLGCV